ncbi:MAG: cobalt ECF transporter T component CbiQ [Synergistaceae bacterium]|jgi:cobalt/nickel transport system permease protein|nr:cobalt ECF transporter T component CbiQ [Synergistaceae bacterium]
MRQPDFGFSGAAFGLNTLELLAEKGTIVHRVHPFVKLAATTVYVFAVISFGRYELAALMPFFFYPAVLIPLSETPWDIILKRLLPALPFSLLGGLGNVFFDRAPMLTLGDIVITGGVVSFISIMIKTLLTVSAILLLVSTTSVADLSRQLAALRIPDIAVLQLVLTYRYLTVLIEETGSMYSGYILRSADSRGIRMRDMGTFVGMLLLRSIDRAGRVYNAMKCRGFSGSFQSPGREECLRVFDILCLCAVCAPAILLRCFA